MLINAQQINKAIKRHKHNFTTTYNRIITGVLLEDYTDNIEWHITQRIKTQGFQQG